MAAGRDTPEAVDRQRIDKWLWHARLAKTRTAAQGLATSGRIRVNREKIQSSSRPVKLGDVLTIAFSSTVRVIRVTGFADRRGSAEVARLLYQDLAPLPVATPGGTDGDLDGSDDDMP